MKFTLFLVLVASALSFASTNPLGQLDMVRYATLVSSIASLKANNAKRSGEYTVGKLFLTPQCNGSPIMQVALPGGCLTSSPCVENDNFYVSVSCSDVLPSNLGVAIELHSDSNCTTLTTVVSFVATQQCFQFPGETEGFSGSCNAEKTLFTGTSCPDGCSQNCETSSLEAGVCIHDNGVSTKLVCAASGVFASAALVLLIIVAFFI